MTRPATEVAKAAKHFVDFVNQTGSPYHTVKAAAGLLKASGFVELRDGDSWSVSRGGKYYVTKGGSEVMAFVVGGKFNQTPKSGLSIVGAHTDSPCLRLRPNSKVSGAGMLQVGIQTYGGGLWHTWFDRPLGVAGKVVVREGSGDSAHLVEKLVHIPEPLMIIPNLAIHLQSADERKGFSPNTESHLQPVLCSKQFDEAASSSAGRPSEEAMKEGVYARHHAALLERVAKDLSCKPEDIVDADLCLMDSNPACLAGLYQEFVSAPRIDNLLSTWAAIQGLCDFSNSAAVADSSDICIAVSFDHEECGSQSCTGAEGATLPSWIDYLLGSLEVPTMARPGIMSRSFLLSADCAHGVHPNYAAKHQSEHRPDFHKGIVIKTNANQRYATTSLTSSLFREVCKKANVPVQDFVVRNDSPCGTTIGPIVSAKTGIRTIDIGAPQWAMHSCRETCSTNDCGHLLTLCSGFYETFREIDNSLESM
mmetsp:Transcript_78299/g.162655  ORF Transcript_78299/g.162655 Transcript_78299/m.162655 type:complete len:479 (+) Transcript_78299:87-1523(+)